MMKEIKTLDRSAVQVSERPVKILQFGEGNFLRAFFDWQIDVANEQGLTDCAVAVVSPRFSANRTIELLRAQQGLYHVCLEGIEEGEPKRETRLVSCIAQAFSPAVDADAYDRLITSPQLRFVVSNTTEAGIRYEPCDVTAAQPATFPAKVTALLYRRYRHFGGAADKGLIFLCCELIEENGTTLHRIVERYAREAALGDDFIRWVDEACIFCDTLVDRIVPGFPADTIDQIKEEIGYDDNLVVKGELYHLWAIGGRGWQQVQRELPLHRAGLHVLFMPSIKAFRDKKVRILNGSHTGMTPVALQLGCETVMQAFNHPAVNRFVSRMVQQEVLPMIDEEPDELRRFADGILERFYNPYIKHYLSSIALNSLSKWEARNYCTAKDFRAKRGADAECELFSLAALLTLYAPGSGFEPQDTPQHVELIARVWDDADPVATVRQIIESDIFTENLEAALPGLSQRVGRYVAAIRSLGMQQALNKFLDNEL